MKYAVQVNYRTHRGNASSRTFVVEANSEPEAVEIANGKARKHPNVQSIVGGDVVEVFSPAPTDWGKEAERIYKMRDSVVAYLKENAPSEHCEFLCETQPTASLIEMAAYIQNQKAIAGGKGK